MKSPQEATGPLLEIEGLRTVFGTERGSVAAVDGVDLTLRPGETLGLAGESGCGKSVLALSILGLVPAGGRIVDGSVRFAGRELRDLAPRELRALRGNELALVFQEPASALNPVLTVGEQIAEVLRLHRGLDRRAARAATIEALREVEIAGPEERYDSYPHQLSGGMRQRVMIAMAMACRPRLLIADEPTTALDVTIQAQILELFRALQRSSGMALLFITHDLGVLSEIADRIAVMYAGRIVECADAATLLTRPRHPYTLGLLRSLPELAIPGAELPTIPGQVPRAGDWPGGCRFRTRCPLARERCAREDPALVSRAGSAQHTVACHFSDEVEVPGGVR